MSCIKWERLASRLGCGTANSRTSYCRIITQLVALTGEACDLTLLPFFGVNITPPYEYFQVALLP